MRAACFGPLHPPLARNFAAGPWPVWGHAQKTLPCASCEKSFAGQQVWPGPKLTWHLTIVQVWGVFLLPGLKLTIVAAWNAEFWQLSHSESMWIPLLAREHRHPLRMASIRELPPQRRCGSCCEARKPSEDIGSLWYTMEYYGVIWSLTGSHGVSCINMYHRIMAYHGQ